MKEIFVPIDFSECSIDALKVAADIARKNDSEIHLVNIYEQPIVGFAVQFRVDTKELNRLKDELKNQMHNLKDKYLSGIHCHLHLVADSSIWELLEDKSFKDVDMVIMGSHGASGAKEFFVGSNTQKVVQMSHKPVLVVKDYFDINDTKKVVFASNFYTENTNFFTPIKEFIKLTNSELHLLKVITPGNFENTRISHKYMDDFAKSNQISDYTKHVYNSDEAESGIREFSNGIDADLIAMETHGRRGIKHMFFGSLAEDLVNHAKLPVLSVHIEES